MSNTILEEVPLLVLAGGRASRLQGFSRSTPKYLMPLDDKRVFADIHLEWAKKQGFKKVILSIGYLGQQIVEYCGDGQMWDLEIKYCDDGSSPLGTGGAVQSSLQFSFEDLAITYGDTLLAVDAKNLYRQMRDGGYQGLMSLFLLDIPGHQSNATIENGLARYSKTSPLPDWNYLDYGFMFLQRRLIENFPLIRPLDLAVPLENYCQKSLIKGVPVKKRFWEIGTPEALIEFQRELSTIIKD
ncbi:MAG: NTP transferase domain-containing protein [Bdellovibrionales bacterium]|nr:NTP transferase domain-containing protein [Bdellovibrionales bacterium]